MSKFELFTFKNIDGRFVLKIFGVKLFSHKLKNAGKKNFIVLIKNDGTKIYNPKLKNVRVKFCGSYNIVKLYEPVSSFGKVDIIVSNKDFVEIKSSKNDIGVLKISCSGHSKVLIDEDFSVVGGVILADYGTTVKIGKDCMFSDGVLVQTSDSHIIYDGNSKKILEAADVELGNHVWLGLSTKVLKKSKIPDGSIVGMGAVTTKPYEGKNLVIAGIPARVVKSNVFWDREYYKNVKARKSEQKVIESFSNLCK